MEERAQQLDRGWVGPMDVVEHEHDRLCRECSSSARTAR